MNNLSMHFLSGLTVLFSRSTMYPMMMGFLVGSIDLSALMAFGPQARVHHLMYISRKIWMWVSGEKPIPSSTNTAK